MNLNGQATAVGMAIMTKTGSIRFPCGGASVVSVHTVGVYDQNKVSSSGRLWHFADLPFLALGPTVFNVTALNEFLR